MERNNERRAMSSSTGAFASPVSSALNPPTCSRPTMEALLMSAPMSGRAASALLGYQISKVVRWSRSMRCPARARRYVAPGSARDSSRNRSYVGFW